jgi:transcriptional regulator with XRE-family HTH domain
MDTRKILGWNLRTLRVAKGLSQERLALEAGIDRSYVGRVERGSENVTLQRLESFATVLGVTVAELLTAPERGSEGSPPRLRSGRKPRR